MPALAGLPILCAAAPFKCGGRGGPDYYTDVAAGPIAIKNVADLYLYPNGLRVVKIDGATRARMAGALGEHLPAHRPEIARSAAAARHELAAYNFDVIDGVTYEIDVTAPARYDDDGHARRAGRARIRDLEFRGAPIDEEAKFLVVTNSYRASGGGSFPGCDGSTIVFEAPDTNRDALMRYVAETRHVDPRREANWKFVPWPANSS